MPAHAGPEAVPLFSHDLLQPLAIEREIRHHAFQLGLLLTELPELPQFTEAQPRLRARPHVTRLLAEADLPAHVHHGRATRCFPQGGEHLFLGMPSSSCPRRVLLLGQEDHVAGRSLTLSLAYFSGFGSPAHLGRTNGLTLNRTLRYTPPNLAVLFFSSHADEVPVRPSHRKDKLHICLKKFAQPFQRGVQP